MQRLRQGVFFSRTVKISGAARSRASTASAWYALMSASSQLGDGKAATDLGAEPVRYLGVPRNRLHLASEGIAPERVRTAFPLEIAPMAAKMLEQRATLHPTVTSSLNALEGTPRKPSSLRSVRIKSTASERLDKHSSFVFP